MMIVAAALAGCTSISSNYNGEITNPTREALYACHGYNCYFKTKVSLTAEDNAMFDLIMADAAVSPDAERAAAGRAIQYFEQRTTQTIGVRDQAKSVLTDSGRKGQMDCIDESTNSRTLLLFLQKHGMLHHHKVLVNVSRGFLLDARYPHSTAVLQDRGGNKWAVDSWYEPGGGAPDILPLRDWFKRGVAGNR